MLNLLQFDGEPIGAKDLGDYLHLLVGDANFKTALPAEVSADEFAENVLGFEEVEEVEDDEADMG